MSDDFYGHLMFIIFRFNVKIALFMVYNIKNINVKLVFTSVSTFTISQYNSISFILVT